MDYESRETELHTAAIHAMQSRVRKAAKIRAELCESRGLPPSSGCHACGRPRETAGQCEHPGVCEWSDSEGGEI